MAPALSADHSGTAGPLRVTLNGLFDKVKGRPEYTTKDEVEG